MNGAKRGRSRADEDTQNWPFIAAQSRRNRHRLPLRNRSVLRVLGSRYRVTRSVAVNRSPAGSRSLAGKFRDTLGHSTWRAQGYVRLTQPPGQDGVAVTHAPVIRVCRAARATTGAPVAGKRGAPGPIAARTAGSSLPSASVVAAATCCRHSPSAAAAACKATVNCRAGLSALPAMALFSHLTAPVASVASESVLNPPPASRGNLTALTKELAVASGAETLEPISLDISTTC